MSGRNHRKTRQRKQAETLTAFVSFLDEQNANTVWAHRKTLLSSRQPASGSGTVAGGSGAKRRISRFRLRLRYTSGYMGYQNVTNANLRVRFSSFVSVVSGGFCFPAAVMNGLLSVTPAESAAHTHDVSPHAWVIPLR